MEGPSAMNLNGMTEMEWLEREQEKEMIELAMERSLNDFQARQSSQPSSQPAMHMREPMHNAMPDIQPRYDNHYGGGARPNMSSQPMDHPHHQTFSHRPLNDRDSNSHHGPSVFNNRQDMYRDNAYDSVGRGTDNAMQSSMSSNNAPFPMMHRSRAPTGYRGSGDVEEIAGTVIDSPHHTRTYDRMGSRPSTPVYHQSRSRSPPSGPLHSRYSYPSATPVETTPPYSGRPSAAVDFGRRISLPEYHSRPNMTAGRDHPNFDVVYGARNAVLATARQHLSDAEVGLVEQALNLATIPNQRNIGHIPQSRQHVSTEAKHSGGSISTYESQHSGGHSPRRYDSRTDISPPQNARTLETMDLLRRASASDYLSRDEINEIEHALVRRESNHSTGRVREEQLRWSPHSSSSSRHHFQQSPQLQPQQQPQQQNSISPRGQRDRLSDSHLHQQQLPSHERQHAAPRADPSPLALNHQQHRQIDSRGHPQQPRRQPQARYRPNPRYADTGVSRTYSGDSLALAKQEIQKAAAANTLSKEEYNQLMRALGGESNNDGDSLRSRSPPLPSGVSNFNTSGRARQREVMPRYSNKGLPPKSASYESANTPGNSNRPTALPRRSLSYGSSTNDGSGNSNHSNGPPRRSSSHDSATKSGTFNNHENTGLPKRSPPTIEGPDSRNHNEGMPRRSSSYGSITNYGPSNNFGRMRPPRQRSSSHDSKTSDGPFDSNHSKGLPSRSISCDSAEASSCSTPPPYRERAMSTSGTARPLLVGSEELLKRSVSLDSPTNQHTQSDHDSQPKYHEQGMPDAAAKQPPSLPSRQFGGSSGPSLDRSTSDFEATQQNAEIIHIAEPDAQEGAQHSGCDGLPIRNEADSNDTRNTVNLTQQHGRPEAHVTAGRQADDEDSIPQRGPAEVILSFNQTVGHASAVEPVQADVQRQARRIVQSTTPQDDRLCGVLVEAELKAQQDRAHHLPSDEVADKEESALRSEAEERVETSNMNELTENASAESGDTPADNVSQQLDDSFSTSSTPKKNRSSELPPRNSIPDLRILGSSHHSRHSKRSSKFSAALAALPYARTTSQGAPGSVSVDFEYSISQFGDSFNTFGSDMLGPQKFEGSLSSVVSFDMDNSRQHQQSFALSPPSLSSRGTVRGVGLLPPMLGGLDNNGKVREDEDVLRGVAANGMASELGSSVHSEGKASTASEQTNVQNNQTKTEESGAGVPTSKQQLPEPLSSQEGVAVAQHMGGKFDGGMTDVYLASVSHSIELSRAASNSEESQDIPELTSAKVIEESSNTGGIIVPEAEPMQGTPSMDDRVAQPHVEALHANADPGEAAAFPLAAELDDEIRPQGVSRFDQYGDGGRQWTEPQDRNRIDSRTRRNVHDQDARYGSPMRQHYQEPLKYDIQHNDGWMQVHARRSVEDSIRDHVEGYYEQQHPLHHQWDDPRIRETEQFHHWDRSREQPTIRERDPRDSEHDFVHHRQHQPSAQLGPSDSERFERHHRQPHRQSLRDDVNAVPEVPQQVQVEPRNRRESWAANARQNSVSSLGESTQYSIFSAHFRQEEYERYRNEDLERAQNEHDNWRQSQPSLLPHALRENANEYYESNRPEFQPTGHSRRQPQHPAAQDHDVPRGNDYRGENDGRPDRIAEHDRFDEDLKRALFESMQMQRESLPHGDAAADEDLPTHYAGLTTEQLNLINRALSGSEPMNGDEPVQSHFDRFGSSVHAAPNWFDPESARFRHDGMDLPTARVASDPTFDRNSPRPVVPIRNDGPQIEVDVEDVVPQETINSEALALELVMQKAEEERQSLLLALELQKEEARRASARSQIHFVPSSDQRVGRILAAVGQMPEVPFSTMPGARPDQLGAVRSISSHRVRHPHLDERTSRPHRPRHPLEDSFSSQGHGTTSNQIGAIRSSSPHRIRHPLEDSYSSLHQSRTSHGDSYGSQSQAMSSSQIGAVRSTGPDRIHPLDGSSSTVSHGRNSQSAAALSTTPMAQRRILVGEANSPRRSPRGPEQGDRSMHAFEESYNSQSSPASLVATRISPSQPRTYEVSYSSELAPDHNPEGSPRHLTTSTPAPQARTQCLSDTLALMSLSEMGQSLRLSDLTPSSAPLSPPGSDANMASITSVTDTSPAVDKKWRQARRDTKVLGSVARLGKKGVSSLIKLASSRKLGSGTNPESVTTVDRSDAPTAEDMDIDTRNHIDRAVSKGVINQLNSAVRFGKEATIYHAEKGSESNGFDVAVKVYKRAQGAVADLGAESHPNLSQFQNISSREQLELWTIKEFRNLKKARRFGVPSPAPLFTKNNILFMQFMGVNGRPAPQLGELDHRRGHKRWRALYNQIVEAVRR
jgi:RIO1 family